MHTQIICRQRPTCTRKWEGKSRSARVFGSSKPIFNLDASFKLDGSQCHHLFADNEVFHIGRLQVTALHVLGHTPADMAYHVDDLVFVGDTLFMPDLGSARCDFPDGSAPTL